MLVYVNRAVEALILPPGSTIVLILAALFFMKRRPGVAKGALILAVVLLIPLSTSWLGSHLIGHLQTIPAIPPAAVGQVEAQAIVIMGSGRYPAAPEYGEDSASPSGMTRLRYGAWLHQRTGLPILVTGGRPGGEARSEADIMTKTLNEVLGTEVRWREERSRTSLENALFSWEMLSREGITKILLVTHANHMPRSVLSFREAGFEVVPAPTLFATRSPNRSLFFDLLPTGSALAGNDYLLHELLGRVWYKLKFFFHDLVTP